MATVNQIPSKHPITIVRVQTLEDGLRDQFFFIRLSFSEVVEACQKCALNSVVNEEDGTACITHELRNEKGFWVNRRIHIERRVA